MRIASLFAFVIAMLLGVAAHAQSVGTVNAPVDDTDLSNVLYLDLSSGGRVTVRLYPTIAPNHVERIKTLTRQGFLKFGWAMKYINEMSAYGLDLDKVKYRKLFLELETESLGFWRGVTAAGISAR